MGECLIIGQTGERKLPVLNPNYPEDQELWGEGGSATFKVEIQKQGSPKEYTYKWYRDGTLASWATGPTCTFDNLSQAKTSSVYCVVANKAGEVTSRVATLTVKNPNMAYTFVGGDHEQIDDGNGNWRIKLKSGGTLQFTNFGKWDGKVDVFCVGGGGGGGRLYNTAIRFYGAGGGGGYTTTCLEIAAELGTPYAIAVGAGGAGATGDNGANVGGEGGTTTAFGLSAAGGKGGNNSTGAAGGSGGGGAARVAKDQDDRVNRLGHGGNGGSDGSDGAAASDGYNGDNGAGGKGQGTTTREFGEATGDLYAGGGGGTGFLSDGTGGAGGGGNAHILTGGENGVANTGGGGGGSGLPSGAGGSGIVVIRNTRNQSSIITQQPQDVSAAENANAIFTVAANGTGLTYQWQFQATDNPGAWTNTSAAGYNTNTLTVQALSSRNNYEYRCLITNADGIKTASLPATLTITGV